MKDNSLVLLLGAIAIAIVVVCTATTNNNKDSDDVCRLFQNNTVIRHPHFCNQKITCIDFVSYPTLCEKSKPFYDVSARKCVAELNDYSSCQEIDCQYSVDRFLADPISCRSYYYCADQNTPLHGACPDGQHFDANTEMCIYSEVSQCKVNYDFCTFVPNNVKFANESTPNTYLTCNAGVLKSTPCKDKTDYDRATGNCMKYLCGSTTAPYANKNVNDRKSCRGYYHCAPKTTGFDENPTWHQCPVDTFFSDTTESCVHPLDSKCEANRCEGRSLQFVVSAKRGCRDYIYCENGKNISAGSCGNYFFHEDVGACMPIVIQYPACS